MNLTTFAARCHDLLAADNSPAGRAQVAVLLSDALRDPAFVAAQFDAASPERKVIHEDPELGFCILAHAYSTAKESPPHDHAHSWAIYGQAEGETHMSDYDLLSPPDGDAPGKVKRARSYKLTPGDAHVYNEGDLHSPRRDGPTKLIRIEGTNMDRVKRAKYVVAP